MLVPIGYTLGRYCTRERSISFSRLCVVVVLRANGGTIPENLCSRWRGGNRGATVLVLGLLERLKTALTAVKAPIPAARSCDITNIRISENNGRVTAHIGSAVGVMTFESEISSTGIISRRYIAI